MCMKETERERQRERERETEKERPIHKEREAAKEKGKVCICVQKVSRHCTRSRLSSRLKKSMVRTIFLFGITMSHLHL